MKIMMMVEGHGDDQVLGLGKEKREKQKAQGKGIICRSILFWWSTHLESVTTFRINSHTIKRGETHIKMQVSKYH